MVILFYEVVTVSLTSMPRMLKLWKKLKEANLPPRVVIDCSHGNSNKDYKLQACIWKGYSNSDGNTSIVGMMLESNLHEGNQPIPSKLEQLKYGVSVTDKCIGWEETEKIIWLPTKN